MCRAATHAFHAKAGKRAEKHKRHFGRAVSVFSDGLISVVQTAVQVSAGACVALATHPT
ncbi:hypothetical protein [Kingella potus]|uniref:hypothetical protein n=1 Tax=Kingella potus TaxID=265175 RepID=UPI001FD17A85|nr:hypothetical protein [Kingella potus]UOP00269.1 hypothetical protein LVJ84_10165 [Kingella potus]